MRWVDCIGLLDMADDAQGWRDDPHNFNPPEELRTEIALAFLRENETWLSDITLPVYSHPLEWVVMILESSSDSKVNELSANAIWNYISKPSCLWLLEQEEAAVAWG
jgi:hypothetical protein